MRSFINSSSESESESESQSKLAEDDDKEGSYRRGEGKKRNLIEERNKPPRLSVFEYMAQQKVMIHGADLDEHIHSNLPSTSELLTPQKKKRKTFYDSSDDEEPGDKKEENTPNCATTLQSGLVVGDLLAKYSPQVSPSSSDHTSVPAIGDEDLDVWLESPQKQPAEDSSSSIANRKRKVLRQEVEWNSSDEETEEVRPQLKTALPVRELASVTLASDSPMPNDDCATSPSPPPPSINKYAAQYLKDYQIQGVQWMYNKYACKAGCILGYCLSPFLCM
jgi:SNF2 family DNA or RNA helicase